MGAWAQPNTTTSTYTPGVTYQKENPNYPTPNPFYFEGRIDWNLLKITQPGNTWEYMERGIHEQDDLDDPTDAIADYQQSIAMNNLTQQDLPTRDRRADRTHESAALYFYCAAAAGWIAERDTATASH